MDYRILDRIFNRAYIFVILALVAVIFIPLGIWKLIEIVLSWIN